jgi:small subunit ribosomal protein S10|tara:strand:+ start:4153 stop:4464 length:312 start_codon:yes stop_codon:yes gene_type:complete
MKFRILLRSFDKELINTASQQLRTTLLNTECKVTGAISLPTRIKRFCVLRSPHVDKDSREHFEVRLYKRFIDITTNSPSVLDLLLKTELPSGVSCSLKVVENV